MLELEKKEKYDPRFYGNLKAEFLNQIDNSFPTKIQPDIIEIKRQELLKELKEGKLLNIG